KDLLGLIHTDVCGPFKIMSRQGASYLVTFTDDFSRYGYVYLLKHKHEVFETFKVFQKEVENQLRKIIKSLRSDSRGEYISQEFLDHLKDHRIIVHRTPPYTLQHNVVDIRAIKILIAIAAYYDYEIWHMDVKIAFLNGYLNEEVYMEQPKSFVNPKYPNHVCKLKRSIYGLEQALRQWNKRFDDEIKNVKTYLGKCFAMKDLGEAAYILGIKIYRDRSKRLIGLCQSVYIEKILKQYCMENSKRKSIPMQEKLKFSKSQGASTPVEIKRMQNVPYASAVGSIMYAVRCTRPDVAFAQNITSRFQQNPGDIHWTTVKNILKYLRNTKDMFLVYGDRICVRFDGGVVDWKSAKKSIFATSSAEAEYIAAFDASKEAVWVRKFISRLRVVPTIEEPISMYCDNTEAIAIANESEIKKGARHFRAKVHYLREVIELGDIKLEKVHTDDNLADPFTKALAFPKHSEHTKNIEMLPASSLM
nr:hypothetical protein [Tanacetum cinerariifolium]